MGEPITVGGGGGLVKTAALADYPIEFRFDDTKFVRNTDGEFVYAGNKIGIFKIQDFAGATTFLDATNLLPVDRLCEIVLRFKNFNERINIKNKPITITFDEDLWTTSGAGSKLWRRTTRHDQINVDLGVHGRWHRLEVGTPGDDFRILVEAVPI
jgi:hypothetical protein